MSQPVTRATTGTRTFSVTEEGGKILIDGEVFDLRVSPLPDGRLQVFKGNHVYVAEVVPGSDKSSCTVLINGHSVSVDLKTPLDLRLEQMGMNAGAARVKNIVSPMPGLITDLKVSAGEEVNVGTPLLVLEAMKMENVLQAPSKAVITSIKVKKGDRVEKGQILVEF
ncbi:MAG: biotin/lipoyl-containing protein [Cyclobacteriaceae bacterium]